MKKSQYKKLLLSPWTAVITLALVLCIRIADPAFVESVRLRYFDTLITNQEPVSSNIYTVNIDEASLDKLGQWPLPRGEYARIIRDLYDRGAGLVVLNVLMPERDRTGGDAVLARTLRDLPVVLPSAPSERTKNQPRAPGSAVINSNHADAIIQYPGLTANIPELEKSAAGVGITNTLPEIDGVNRRIPLVVAVDGRLYPGLALETLRVATANSTFQVKLFEGGVEKMRLPGEIGVLSTDALGRIWIDWSQQPRSVSLVDLPKDLGGAIVVVGPTAAGISNPVPTARGAVFPHEVQATVMSTLINKTNIQRPDWADGAEILALLTAGILLLFLTRWVYVGMASVAGLIVVFAYGSDLAFGHGLWLFDITGPIAGLVLVALHAYGVKFVSEFLQKQQIKKQFGTYLSPAMVEKLQRNPELLQLGGESRELSIMFTDVRGFTTISEHYGEDVQGLTRIMNRYMTAMTARIIENNGTLDKYIGDAQMAFWNAPLDDAEHAVNAVRTGLAMLGDLEKFNEEIRAEGVPPFGMGLGINTATVVVGNMGSDQRFDYTCLGDGVNLASRLEGQSKPYGVRIVVGPKTAELVKDHYFVLELDTIAVKGKSQGVTIFTVMQQPGAESIEEWNHQRELHDLMLEYYRKQQWDKAQALVDTLLMGSFDQEMDVYYAHWLERIEEMRQANLPTDWDGIYRATSK